MSDWIQQEWSGWDAHAVHVTAAEFVVTTPTAADVTQYSPLSALLQRVHEAFGVELAFVCEWAGGEPLTRPHEGDGAPGKLQALYGQRLLESGLEGRERLAFEAIPVVCRGGFARGTLCCRYPQHAGAAADGIAAQLRSVAELIARWFETAPLAA